MGQQKPRYIEDASMAADVNGAWINILGQRHVCFQAAWSGSAPVGPFVIKVTNDGTSTKQGGYTPTGRLGGTALTLPSSWTAYFPGGASDAGAFVMDLDVNAAAIMFMWDRTSGTGTLNVGFVAKGID